MGSVDTAKRLMNRLRGATLPAPVVFHHVPKCGGTSVGRAFRRRYLLSQATVKPEESFRAFAAFTGRNDREQMLVDVLDLREQMMLYHMFDGVQCLSLHVRFSSAAHAAFADHYRFVTVLREPVARFVSHYFWSFGKPNAHARIEEDFETFLTTERAKRLGATYAEYFSGLPKDTDFTSDAAVSAAVENLRRFDAVGRLDDLATFATDVRKATGARLRIGAENRARQPDDVRRAVMTPENIAKVKTLCAPDQAIWDQVFG